MCSLVSLIISDWLLVTPPTNLTASGEIVPRRSTQRSDIRVTVGRRKKSRCRGVLSRPIYTISSFDSRYWYRHYPGGATSIINSALSLATRSNAERFAWTYSTAAPDIIGAYSEQAPLKNGTRMTSDKLRLMFILEVFAALTHRGRHFNQLKLTFPMWKLLVLFSPVTRST